MWVVSNPLRPDLVRRGQRLKVENETRLTEVVRDLLLALGPWSRLRGLLGRSLVSGQGLLLRPCRGVHTFFMGYPIDVIFLDKDGVVLALFAELRPWRATPFVDGACCALELAAGQASSTQTVVGDRLLFLKV